AALDDPDVPAAHPLSARARSRVAAPMGRSQSVFMARGTSARFAPRRKARARVDRCDCGHRRIAVVRRGARGIPPPVAALRRLYMSGPPIIVPLLRLSDIGKDYAKVNSRGGRLRLVWDLLRGHGAEHVFRALDGV